MRTFCRAFLWSMAMAVLVIAMVETQPEAAGAGYGRSCYSCYTPSYYYPQQYYYPPPQEIVYVNSAILFQPFEFRYIPPQALLTVYGQPQITSTTTTVTTTSAVTGGTVQTTVLGAGGAAGVANVGGVTTVAPGTPQGISDGLPVAQPWTDAPAPATSTPGGNSGVAGPAGGDRLAGFFKQNNCTKCHQGSSASGGVTLLDSAGKVALARQGGKLTIMDVLDSIEANGKCPGCSTAMPPGSDKEASKKVPLVQRRIVWDEAKKRQ